MKRNEFLKLAKNAESFDRCEPLRNDYVAKAIWGNIIIYIYLEDLYKVFTLQNIIDYPESCCYKLLSNKLKPFAEEEGVKDFMFMFHYKGINYEQLKQ